MFSLEERKYRLWPKGHAFIDLLGIMVALFVGIFFLLEKWVTRVVALLRGR